jgi:hypothetical protein
MYACSIRTDADVKKLNSVRWFSRRLVHARVGCFFIAWSRLVGCDALQDRRHQGDQIGWIFAVSAISSNVRLKLQFLATFFSEKCMFQIWENMVWAAFWVIFLLKHLVTLFGIVRCCFPAGQRTLTCVNLTAISGAGDWADLSLAFIYIHILKRVPHSRNV